MIRHCWCFMDVCFHKLCTIGLFIKIIKPLLKCVCHDIFQEYFKRKNGLGFIVWQGLHLNELPDFIKTSLCLKKNKIICNNATYSTFALLKTKRSRFKMVDAFTHLHRAKVNENLIWKSRLIFIWLHITVISSCNVIQGSRVIRHQLIYDWSFFRQQTVVATCEDEPQTGFTDAGGWTFEDWWVPLDHLEDDVIGKCLTSCVEVDALLSTLTSRLVGYRCRCASTLCCSEAVGLSWESPFCNYSTWGCGHEVTIKIQNCRKMHSLVVAILRWCLSYILCDKNCPWSFTKQLKKESSLRFICMIL